MTRRFGIDTSILVRLLTGDPEEGFRQCVAALTALVQGGAEVFASNQVVGEAYVAVQHHYGVSKGEARTALTDVLKSGIVSPLNGASVLAALEAEGVCGLLDRLIADDYRRADLFTLTLDERMAKLPAALLLQQMSPV
jgi:predicted nucleic acid-binding protein